MSEQAKQGEWLLESLAETAGNRVLLMCDCQSLEGFLAHYRDMRAAVEQAVRWLDSAARKASHYGYPSEQYQEAFQYHADRLRKVLGGKP